MFLVRLLFGDCNGNGTMIWILHNEALRAYLRTPKYFRQKKEGIFSRQFFFSPDR
jgi:hypothetical protein